MAGFPIHNARLLPADVNQLLLMGGWLMGSAADPQQDYRNGLPKDFDICVEPPEAAIFRALLVTWQPVRHTKVGGTVYKSNHGGHTIDIWFSTLGETFRAMIPTKETCYAINLRYNRFISYSIS